MTSTTGPGGRRWTKAELTLARRLGRQECLEQLLSHDHCVLVTERNLVAEALRALSPDSVERVKAHYREIVAAEEREKGDPWP